MTGKEAEIMRPAMGMPAGAIDRNPLPDPIGTARPAARAPGSGLQSCKPSTSILVLADPAMVLADPAMWTSMVFASLSFAITTRR